MYDNASENGNVDEMLDQINGDALAQADKRRRVASLVRLTASDHRASHCERACPNQTTVSRVARRQ